MAKIGKKPVKVPEKVKIAIGPEGLVVEGPKGKLVRDIPAGVKINIKGAEARVEVAPELENGVAFQGLVRGILSEMLVGVTEGYKRELELQGVGFRAAVKGTNLELSLGFSHPVVFPIEKDIKVKAAKPTQLVLEGIDKIKIGRVAARIRQFYPPEPYKGKGIRYKGEQVRRKQGKAVT